MLSHAEDTSDLPDSLHWRSLLADMARRVFPFGKASLMCALEWAMADESGIHHGAPVCIVAGYLASPTDWMLLDEQWVDALRKAGVEYFHATEFFDRRRGRGIYGRLTEDSAAVLIDRLLTAIEGCNVYPFGAAIVSSVFEALTYGERRFITGGLFDHKTNRFRTNGAPSKPYFLGFQHALVEVSQRVGIGDLAHFIFANNEQYRARALETFDEAKAMMVPGEAERIGGCMFWEAKKVSPLQARRPTQSSMVQLYVLRRSDGG